MVWKVYIDSVIENTATVDSIEENLNGYIEATFSLPNTSTNRTLADADHTIEIKWNTTSEFIGVLKAPEFHSDRIVCKCYQTCIEQMQRKVHTGTHSVENPATILSEVCVDAGVLAGVCPTTPVQSIHTDKAYTYDVARYLAWVLANDIYPDFSGVSPRINIGTAGSGGPSGRGYLHYSITPVRNKDRAKKRDKVYVRGLAADGSALTGSAGTGLDVAVFTDRTATTQATLDALAAKYLADLNITSSGCVVTVAIESPVIVPAYVQGYDIHAGDYVIFTCAELGYSASVVRVYKVTKRYTDVVVEVEKAELLLDDYINQANQWESLGIFPPASVAVPDVTPITPSGFGTDDVVVATKQASNGEFTSLFVVTVHRVDTMAGYVVRWQVSGDASWNYVSVSQPTSGDATINTGPVVMGQTYNLQVASYNKDGLVSAFTASVSKLVTVDTTAPATPTGLSSTSLIKQILLTWTANTEVDLKGYNVYHGTATNPTTLLATCTTNYLIVSCVAGTAYYFRVRAFDELGNLSGYSSNTGPTIATNESVDNINDTIPAIPVIACLAQEIDTAAEHRTWIQITITRVTNAGGYVVSYKKTVDPEWIHFFVEQPSSGNPIATTPDLLANTSYDVHACSISKLGQASAWSATTTLSTLANTTAPSVPTGLSVVPVVDGVLVSWNPVTANDLSHYKVFYGTTNPPTVVASQTNRPYHLWYKLPAEAYTLYYFAITAVDTAGNESAKCTAVSTTPTQVKPIDLSIESRPWTANLKIWEDETTLGKIYWADPTGLLDATVKFADGTLKTITKNLTGTSYTVGLRYFYWDATSVLANTTDYGTAVGEGKGLIAVVDVRTDRRSTILPFNSYSPTIGSGCIAANTILTSHIKAGQITTSLITSDVALAIKASQIVLDGSTSFINTWQKSGDVTKIDGGNISTGTVRTDQILFNILATDPTYTAGKLWWLKSGVIDQLRFSSGTTLAEVAIIPKYPLSQSTAPTENLISNYAFELDRDGDGVPDYWSYYAAAGSGSIATNIADQVSGQQSCKVNAAASSNIAAVSDKVPIDPTKSLHFECQSKPSKTDVRVKVDIFIYGYDRLGAYVGAKSISNFFRSTTVWTKDTIDTNPSTDATWSYAPGKSYLDIRYCSVGLYCNSSIYPNSTSYVLFDEVYLSYQRAATPTSSLVAATQGYGYQTLTPTAIETFYYSTTFLVPNEDHELWIGYCRVKNTGTSALGLECFIYDETDALWYPGGTLSTNYGIYLDSAVGDSDMLVVMIPKNVKGHTLKWAFFNWFANVGGAIKIYRSGHGHSPHTHR
jgi:hypothetical protein